MGRGCDCYCGCGGSFRPGYAEWRARKVAHAGGFAEFAVGGGPAIFVGPLGFTRGKWGAAGVCGYGASEGDRKAAAHLDLRAAAGRCAAVYVFGEIGIGAAMVAGWETAGVSFESRRGAATDFFDARGRASRPVRDQGQPQRKDFRMVAGRE